MTDKINIIRNLYQSLKEQDCHINDNDSIDIIRRKDMIFGQIIAYERILEILEDCTNI